MVLPVEGDAIHLVIDRGTALLAHLTAENLHERRPEIGAMVSGLGDAIRDLVTRVAVAEWEAKLKVTKNGGDS